MPRFLFLMPVPMPPEVLATFAKQLDGIRRADVELEFRAPPRGATLLDSPYEAVMAEATVLKAGASAQDEGFDAVCTFSMSDSGVYPLRSRLSIPVIGAGMAALTLAAQLGKKFSVITMWEPWLYHARDQAAKCGLSSALASVRHINTRPDTQELLSGKEDFVFDLLETEARSAIEEDGAEVIILGSTTMDQSYAHLVEHLPCPVVNPGHAAYKACETLYDLKLMQSRLCYHQPEVINDDVFAT